MCCSGHVRRCYLVINTIERGSMKTVTFQDFVLQKQWLNQNSIMLRLVIYAGDLCSLKSHAEGQKHCMATRVGLNCCIPDFRLELFSGYTEMILRQTPASPSCTHSLLCGWTSALRLDQLLG